MPLVSAKCTNCGAFLEADNTKDAAICPYCGSPYIVEKAINNYNVINNISASVVNVYGGISADFVIRAGTLEKYNGATVDVLIPSSVTSIGNGAFAGCSGLTSVKIPNSVISIGNGAFARCFGLTSIMIPNSVISIGDYAFANCSRLTNIVIPDSVTEIGCAIFRECANLQEVSLPHKITAIPDKAFENCTHLKNCAIPYGVKCIGHSAFENCNSLGEVFLPNSVNTIGSSAFHCKLNTIHIPDSVECISFHAFRDTFDYTEHVEHIDASEEWKRKHHSCSKLLDAYNQSGTTKKGCYIATAVYNTYDCPEVWTLRRYRDYILAETWFGRVFIHMYYAISPWLVKWFGSAEWFKNLWKPTLDKMVTKLNSEGIANTSYQDRTW